MREVWKFKMADRCDRRIPIGAEIVHTGIDADGSVCLWAVVDTKAKQELRTFVVVGTGQPFDSSRLDHVGSVVTGSGFVWHVFEVAA